MYCTTIGVGVSKVLYTALTDSLTSIYICNSFSDMHRIAGFSTSEVNAHGYMSEMKT